VPFERGEDWGEQGPLPAEGVVVSTDAEARRVVEDARRRGEDPPPLGLLGGDLAATLGATGAEARLHRHDATRVRVDVGSVLLDGRLHWFVAHLVARRSWWRGRIVAAMNADAIGRLRVAPRAHPGDGRLDLVDADPPVLQRLEARRRLRTGDHVPHPDISIRPVEAVQLDLDPPLRVWLDGEALGPARALSIRVEPAGLIVVVG
jgi:diacylglycerol kinase family enzyme